MEWYDEHVEMLPGIQGGAPVLKGTRTPVSTVVVLYYRTYPNDFSQVQAALPHLTNEQIRAALAYYQEHKSIIDADLERHRAALQRISAA